MRMSDLIRNRPTPEGIELGQNIARLIQPEIDKLWKENGIPDLRCQSCAFRAGTVPNGCGQTILDALECVENGPAFVCHQNQENLCHGYVAAVAAKVAGERE